MSEGVKCPYPVIQGAKMCCGDSPCTVRWKRLCDPEGCWDRSTCGGCEEPVFKGEPGYDNAGRAALSAGGSHE